jgi:hypothetical protein
MPRSEAASWSSYSRFKHCAMHSAIRSPKFNPLGTIGLRGLVMILFDRRIISTLQSLRRQLDQSGPPVALP